MFLVFLGQFGRKIESFWKSTYTQDFLLISKKFTVWDSAARIAFCGWFISARGNIQAVCSLPSNSVGIYYYLVIVSCCIPVWPQEIIQDRQRVPNQYKESKAHSPHMVFNWLTYKERSGRKVTNSFSTSLIILFPESPHIRRFRLFDFWNIKSLISTQQTAKN